MHHPAKGRRFHVADLDPFPGIVGLCVIGSRINKLAVFIFQPAGAPTLLELRQQLWIHLGEIDHVIKRIGDLAGAERAA